jgi:hypothetical protein
MKTFLSILAIVLAAIPVVTPAAPSDWKTSLREGKVDFKSMGPIAFGPEGLLFVADTKAAAIVALATADAPATGETRPFKIEGINAHIAALLGTTPEQVLINDMAVNPSSRLPYLAVSRGRGTDAVPVLVRINREGQPQVVSLESVRHARAELPDAPLDGVVGNERRKSNPRLESITDIAFFEDRVLVAGLSNEEFSSTFRAIPFPFKTVANGTSVEIYHGAHGRFETGSPVRTFVPLKFGQEAHLVAAYTCTPLVHFPVSELKPGAKITGKTIAELGNRNRPLDMIVYQKDGKDYLLLANSSRGIMKIAADQFSGLEGIKAPVPDGKKQGATYETIETWTGVEQLDRLDAGHALVVRRSSEKSINLESLDLP